MARQTIGSSRYNQRTAGAATNANFSELYGLNNLIPLNNTAANATFVVPAGHEIVGIAFQNTTANAVTGGVKIGTTNGGVDVVASQAVGANALGTVVSADILKRLFNATADTTLYLQAVTAWNSANVNFRVMTRKLY